MQARGFTSLSELQEWVGRVGEPVVVDFGSERCSPCRRLEPVLEDLARRYEGRVRVAYVDASDAVEIAQAYRIRAMPTLLAFRGGKVVGQLVGFGARAPVERMFEELAGGVELEQAG